VFPNISLISDQIHAEIMLEVPVEHGLLMETLLDLAHAPFTHTSTFAKGWPVPEAVKFHAQRLLSGAWDPYPIDMAFQPPCMVLSTIGLAQPGASSCSALLCVAPDVCVWPAVCQTVATQDGIPTGFHIQWPPPSIHPARCCCGLH
jgi:hypothetical protein